jgi:hypothetical protein
VVTVDLVEGEVRHEASRHGAVPVLLVGREEHAVARPDDLYPAAPPLRQADAFGHEDRLAERMRMPGRARARSALVAVAYPGRSRIWWHPHERLDE